MLHKRFTSNLKFKLVGEFFSRLASFLFYSICARLLGVENFGVFSLAYSYGFVFIVLIDLGANYIVTREIARDKDFLIHTVPSLHILKWILFPLMVLFVFLATYFTGNTPQVVKLAVMLSLLAMGIALSEFLASILNGIEMMGLEAVLKIIWRMGILGCSILGYFWVKSIEAFVWGMVIAHWIGVLIGYYLIQKRYNIFKWEWKFERIKDLLKISYPVLLAWFIITIYDNQDMFILSKMGFSKGSIGYFSASAKLIDALRPLPVLVVGALYPILSQYSFSDKKTFNKLTIVFFRNLAFVLIPLAFFLSSLAPLIIKVLYGDVFLPAIPIFSISIWGFVFIFLNHFLFLLLLSLNGQFQFLKSALFVCIVNGILAIFLFPRFGILGGGWALFIGEFLLCGFNAWQITRLMGEGVKFFEHFLFPVIVLFVSFICFYFIQSSSYPYFYLFLGMLVYLYLMVKKKWLDLAYFKRMVGR
ncbi:MAG: oligosaccharide flippase family protein [Elusimicrobiota bacterium]